LYREEVVLRVLGWSDGLLEGLLRRIEVTDRSDPGGRELLEGRKGSFQNPDRPWE